MRAINGVYNASASPGRARAEDRTFERVIQAFRRIQQAGALGVRIEKRGTEEVTLVFFDRKASERIERDIHYLHEVLELDPATKEFVLTFGSIQRSKNEISMKARAARISWTNSKRLRPITRLRPA